MTPEFTLVQKLKMRGLTLALAESCTGGLIAKRVTTIAGASTVFTGGIVCYANEVKCGLLGVPAEIIEQEGAVSRNVAKLLAANTRSLFNADLAAAVTGIAGPDGGTPNKPVGLVYIAVAGPSCERVHRFIFSGDRRMVRRQASATTLTMLLECF